MMERNDGIGRSGPHNNTRMSQITSGDTETQTPIGTKVTSSQPATGLQNDLGETEEIPGDDPRLLKVIFSLSFQERNVLQVISSSNGELVQEYGLITGVKRGSIDMPRRHCRSQICVIRQRLSKVLGYDPIETVYERRINGKGRDVRGSFLGHRWVGPIIQESIWKVRNPS